MLFTAQPVSRSNPWQPLGQAQGLQFRAQPYINFGASQGAPRDYYDELAKIYGSIDTSKISDPWEKKAAEWQNAMGLADLAGFAAGLRSLEARRAAEAERMKRDFDYFSSGIMRDFADDSRNLLSMLNAKGILDSGITAGRTSDLMDRTRSAMAKRAAEYEAAMAGLGEQARNEWQDVIDQIMARRASRAAEAQRIAEALRSGQFERDVTEAGLTGSYKGAPTMSERQRLFENALAEADLTGLYKGSWTVPFRKLWSEQTGIWYEKPSWPALQRQAELTGAYNPPVAPGNTVTVFPAPILPSWLKKYLGVG